MHIVKALTKTFQVPRVYAYAGRPGMCRPYASDASGVWHIQAVVRS
jgi:hypothetical protein